MNLWIAKHKVVYIIYDSHAFAMPCEKYPPFLQMQTCYLSGTDETVNKNLKSSVQRVLPGYDLCKYVNMQIL